MRTSWRRTGFAETAEHRLGGFRVRVSELCLQYRDRHRVVPVIDNASFELTPGELVALVGESGSGKTTLLLALGLLHRPAQGDVIVGQVGTAKLPDAARTRLRQQAIGIVFQGLNLLSHLDATANVQVSAADPRAFRAKAVAMLREVGLGDRLAHRPDELSLGQQQRVALVRSLVNEPRLLLADEPTGSLDPSNTEMVFRILREQARSGRIVVLATHDHELARRADRILTITGGRVEETTMSSDYGKA